MTRFICSFLAFVVCVPASAQSPRVLDARYQLELFASDPRIVTPVAVAFDHRGRLLVIESHTHKRDDDYDGPPHDRILRLTDADGDGRADTSQTFFEGSADTMSLLSGPDKAMLVATRREIFALFDDDDDGASDRRATLVRLETSGDYPHNGLAGLALSPSGKLCFGLGENLGEPYRLTGSDGSSLTGEGEGGSVYQGDVDGGNLQRIATGFWNPFGNCFDAHGRWFSVDNDPDASPPCRLILVARSGDYGYQFRYGRSGRHPLQAWNGELPGTLPMAAGTGEAPCQILAFHNSLWVTSWGDHRLERYEVESVGAGVAARRDIVVQGDEHFRPVGLAIAPDGSLYFSDWVDKSYPVHGKGRIWRLSVKSDVPLDDHGIPPLSAAEQRAARLQQAPTLDDLQSDDPFMRQAAIHGWSRDQRLRGIQWSELPAASQRLGILQARYWNDPRPPETLIARGLKDPSSDVLLYTLRMIADGRRLEFQSAVEQLVQSDATQPGVWRAAAATLAWLNEGTESKDTKRLEELLVQMLKDGSSSDARRIRALRYLPADHDALGTPALQSLLDGPPTLQREVVRVLSVREGDEVAQLLNEIANSERIPGDIRADAIGALSRFRDQESATLDRLTGNADPRLRLEAQRSLQASTTTQNAVTSTDIDVLLPQFEVGGDARAGRRVFFRAVRTRCSNCHAHDGRGGTIGPDLTGINRRATRRWLLESILTPNREVSPRYSSVAVTTDDGQTYQGLPEGGPGDTGREVLMQSDGAKISIATSRIVERRSLQTSIMPTGLGNMLSADELRDLLAYGLPRKPPGQHESSGRRLNRGGGVGRVRKKKTGVHLHAGQVWLSVVYLAGPPALAWTRLRTSVSRTPKAASCRCTDMLRAANNRLAVK